MSATEPRDPLELENQALREECRRKDEFLATLAHELRNPLAPIRAAAHAIKLLKLNDARLSKAHAMIERQVTHISRLVEELAELSSATLGRIDLQLRPESLASLLQDVIDAARPSVEARRQELTVHLPDEPLVVRADAMRLHQAISNVLGNAVKYTPQGGRITVIGAREGAFAAIRIEDTGIGIPPERLARTFEVSQGERSGTHGLGIGLAITRKLVELQGGSIAVESDGPNEGAAFTIRIPLTTLTVPAEDAPASEAAFSRMPPRRVLIVDDNVDAADSLRMLLELSGHAVAVEYGGAAALDTVESFRPDVVLLDIGLPDVDGYEVAREIRARHGTDGLTLVAVSGWGQPKDKERSAEAGIDLHFTKPIDSARLASVLGARK
jgi:CheY-like chemotaxis protein/two-component sensor histidine kinase